MKYVLVTGGAGYIGSHAAKRLSQTGYTPVVIDNLSTGHLEFVKWGPFVHADLRNTSLVEKILKDYKPVGVIHFAGSSNAGESVKNPIEYYNNNVNSTLSLISAMQAAEISRIIFSSTSAVYGETDEKLIKETNPKKPLNPYGRSKLMIEDILYDCFMSHGIGVTSLRYFNACGADNDLDIGERHEPELHLIPRAIGAAMGLVPDFCIFGRDYSTHDGTAVRDYIHVEDLADAHLIALEKLFEVHGFSVYNLGSGQGYSVLDIINSVNKHVKSNVPLKYSPRRIGDPASLIADPSLAAKELGFVAKRSSLDEIVHSAVKWHAVDYERR